MSHFDDVKDLVAHAEDDLIKIRKAYDESLSEQSVKRNLLIDIKNLMENLRSALDFTAHGLFERYGKSSRKNPRVYFPYASLGQTQAEFQSANRIEVCIPGISSSRPDILAKFDSYQHYTHPDNRWLPQFMDLNNENKHERLTPQTREEARQLRLASSGASISLGPDSSISMGPRTSIRIGGMTISGGQQISGDRPAQFSGHGKQTLTVWVSFNFESNGEPVLPFLKNAIEKTRQIVTELESM